MRALVTGSNGFIGSHLVEYLLVKNYDVTCLVRPTSNLQWLRGLDVKYAYGDCSKKETLYDAVTNQDYVFHLAGKIKATDWDTYYRANYLGTRNIVEACAEVNPDLKCLVYVSSISAAGPSVRGRLKNEDDECRPTNEYGKTKLLGEEAVKSYAGKVPYVIIRPPNVLGPRQEDLYSILKIINHRIKPLLGNRDNQLSICFVQDLVRGIEMSATYETTGGKIYYITDGKTYSWRNIADVIAKELGVADFLISIPHPILIVITAIMGLFARLRGKKTFFSGKQVKQIRETYLTYDGSKAERDFGFRAHIDLETGIRDTIEWYREQRLL